MSHEENYSAHAEVPIIPFIITQIDELYCHKSEDKSPLFLVDREDEK